ncbi:hypothetical protein SLEP1_g4052 [Rubroshorea leprosula]|uniref:Uncharacterized protein n=1 Tax=Rubroshorea leprosula TaxID=152421 RepID=A0AAV5HTF8_9ROSI|nr:hypothetical protein SLEP1_g4052 [Rubroshorea leprosula]
MRGSRKYTSRVHVEDICQALKASIDMPSSRYGLIVTFAWLHFSFRCKKQWSLYTN